MKKHIAILIVVVFVMGMFPISAAAAEEKSGFKVSYTDSSADEATPSEPEYEATVEAETEPAESEPVSQETSEYTMPEETAATCPATVCPTENPDPRDPGVPDEPTWSDPTDVPETLCTEASEPWEVDPATEAPTFVPATEAPATASPTIAPTAAPTVSPTKPPAVTDPTEKPTPFKPVVPLINQHKSIPRLNLITGTMRAGKTLALEVYNTGGKKVTFSSSNKKVAKVSKKGIVTTLKKGFARITAKVGSRKCYFTLKVISNPSLSKNSVRIKKGRTKKILIYDKAPSVKLKFKNKKKARIVSAGTKNYIKVRARQRGKTTLKVRVNGKWLSLKVKII